ncbi:autoinducer 2 ABC transporter permease LsrC [Kaistia algarum]|uniref:ABC transporter permease subunit n=1 Tax=Kaistia algarum TaxID=2083279 RepID=UPI000CE88538|nr:autoinducer 2 ABC transporter permease LsrC [Kaistia algarum]MCX5512583.1 autoinducer 2 ABC transporter permease LsrC [Kaistia algarum]PPE81894.1 autoinducer 2 ABC transporter permease LsrC [Kaistia algarum]
MLSLVARHRAIVLVLVMAIACMAIGLAAPGYLSLATASVILSNSLVLLMISLGTMLVILTRNIDVSSGSILGLSAAVLGLAMNAGVSLPLAIALCLLTGLAAGALNGALVALLGIPSIVATLGTLGLYRGIMLIATGGRWIEDLPQELKALAGGLDFGVSLLALVTLAILALAWIFLRQSQFGRYFYAVGDNREAARHLGVPVRRVQFLAFVAAGACASVAGIIFAAQIGFIPNQAGNGVELKAIAVNVLGGVSLLGGTGSVAGVFTAAIFLTSIDSALVFLKIPAYWNDFIAGAILLTVLLLDGRIRLAIDRRIRARRYAVHARTPQPETPSTPRLAEASR